MASGTNHEDSKATPSYSALRTQYLNSLRGGESKLAYTVLHIGRLVDRLIGLEHACSLAKGRQDISTELRSILSPLMLEHNHLMDALHPICFTKAHAEDKRSAACKEEVDEAVLFEERYIDSSGDARSATVSEQRDLGSHNGGPSRDRKRTDDDDEAHESEGSYNRNENETNGNDIKFEVVSESESEDNGCGDCDSIIVHSHSEEDESIEGSQSDSEATEIAPSDWFDEGVDNVIAERVSPAAHRAVTEDSKCSITDDKDLASESKTPRIDQMTRTEFVERHICRRQQRGLEEIPSSSDTSGGSDTSSDSDHDRGVGSIDDCFTKAGDGSGSSSSGGGSDSSKTDGDSEPVSGEEADIELQDISDNGIRTQANDYFRVLPSKNTAKRPLIQKRQFSKLHSHLDLHRRRPAGCKANHDLKAQARVLKKRERAAIRKLSEQRKTKRRSSSHASLGMLEI